MKKFFKVGVFVAIFCCVGLFGCSELKESNVTPIICFENDFAIVGTTLNEIGIDISSGDTYGEIDWVDPTVSIKLGKNSYEWKFEPYNNSYKNLTGKVEIVGYEVVEYAEIEPLDIVYARSDLSSQIINAIEENFDNKLTATIGEDYSIEIKNSGEYLVPIVLTANEFTYIKNGKNYVKNIDTNINVAVGKTLPEVEKLQDKTFDGTSQKPEIKLNNLTENIDYILTFEYAKNEEFAQLNLSENNFVNAGKYRIIVTGKNNFYGTKTIEFEIKKSIANVTNIEEFINANNNENYYKINISNNIEINNLTINKEIEIDKNAKIPIFNTIFNEKVTNNGGIIFFDNLNINNLINNGKLFYCPKNFEELKFGIENYSNIILRDDIKLDKNETIILDEKLDCAIDLNGHELKNIDFKILKNEIEFAITNTSKNTSKIYSQTTIFEIESQDKMSIEISNIKLESKSNVFLAKDGENANIKIKNCEIISSENSTALIFLANNNYTICDSKISAGNCITISSGNLNLDNSTLNILTIFETGDNLTTTTGCGVQIVNDREYTTKNISVTLNKITFEGEFRDCTHPIHYTETYGTEKHTFLTFADIKEGEITPSIYTNSDYYFTIAYAV